MKCIFLKEDLKVEGSKLSLAQGVWLFVQNNCGFFNFANQMNSMPTESVRTALRRKHPTMLAAAPLAVWKKQPINLNTDALCAGKFTRKATAVHIDSVQVLLLKFEMLKC